MQEWMLVMLLAATPGMTQDDAPKASDGKVMLPADGATSTSAFAVVQNPGMYDVYLVSASSDIAGNVELRQGADGEAKELRVTAYGKLTMKPDGAHLELIDLKRPLEQGESVRLTLVTDSNVRIRVDAVVQKE